MVCHAVLAQAERSRLEGRSDPQAWQRAAECWERLEHRYAAAYARLPAGGGAAWRQGAAGPDPAGAPGRAPDHGGVGGGAAGSRDRAAGQPGPPPPSGAGRQGPGTRSVALPGGIVWPDPAGGRGTCAGGRRKDQPPDRRGAVHHREDRQRARLAHPGQAWAWPAGARRPRSPTAWGWTDDAACAAGGGWPPWPPWRSSWPVSWCCAPATSPMRRAAPKVEIREGGTVQTTAIQEPSGFNPHTSKDGGGVALQPVAATMYPSVFRIHPDFSFQLDQTFMASAELTSHRSPDHHLPDPTRGQLVGRHADHRRRLHLSVGAPQRHQPQDRRGHDRRV